MKFKKFLALILAGVIATSPGGMISEAADVDVKQGQSQVESSVTYEDVMDAVNAFYKENGSDLRARAELKTKPAKFSFTNITKNNKMNPLKAIKLSDINKESMAQDAIENGTISKDGNNYIIEIKVKPIEKMNIKANLTGLELYYYDSLESKELSKVEAEVANNEYVKIKIPNTACGLTTGDAVYDNGVLLNNMIKVRMTTDIEDKWYAGLVPEKMKNPTCFIAFNVEE